jgi:outer membrane protein assembly factor BamA
MRLLMLVIAAGTLRAQGGGTPTPSYRSSSVRPVLVAIEFEGNDNLTDEQIQAVIQSRPTKVPVVKRFFALIGQLVEENPAAPRKLRQQVGGMIDSLGGELRYLNMTLAAEDTIRMRTLYNDFGYHDAEFRIRATLDTVRNSAILRFIIKEHRRYPLRGVGVFGLEDVPDQLRGDLVAPKLVELGAGYRKDDIINEANRIVVVLRNNGYAFAAAGTPTLLTARRRDSIDGAPFDSAMVVIYPGGRYRFGETTHQPDTTVKGKQVSSELVLDQREYQPGEIYSREKVDQTLTNIYALGAFDLASMDTAATISRDSVLGMRIFTRMRQLHELRIALEGSLEKRFTEYVPSIGISSSYSEMNLFTNSADRGTISGRFLTPLRSLFTKYPLTESQGGLALTYQQPSWPSFPIKLIDGRRLGWLVSGSADFNVVDRIRDTSRNGHDVTLRSERYAAVAELSYRFPRYTFINLGSFRVTYQYNGYKYIAPYIDRLARIRVDTTTLVNGCTDTAGIYGAVRDALIRNIYHLQVLQGDDESLIPPEEATAHEQFNALKRTLIFSLSAVGDHRNDFFAPTDGNFFDGRSELGITGGFNGFFAKLEGQFRQFNQWGPDLVFAYRAHIGYIQEFGEFPLTPISSRFSAGGANSLRGWGAGEMLATRSPGVTNALVAACADPIVRDIVAENRRLLGGLGILEVSAELRYQLFDLPNTSTLGRQLNQLVWIGFADAGNAFFRDRADIRELGLSGVLKNIGVDIGMSLGYNTPVGPFRVGFGIPIYDPVANVIEDRSRFILNRKFFDSFVWHVGIGHAF